MTISLSRTNVARLSNLVSQVAFPGLKGKAGSEDYDIAPISRRMARGLAPEDEPVIQAFLDKETEPARATQRARRILLSALIDEAQTRPQTSGLPSATDEELAELHAAGKAVAQQKATAEEQQQLEQWLSERLLRRKQPEMAIKYKIDAMDEKKEKDFLASTRSSLARLEIRDEAQPYAIGAILLAGQPTSDWAVERVLDAARSKSTQTTTLRDGASYTNYELMNDVGEALAKLESPTPYQAVAFVSDAIISNASQVAKGSLASYVKLHYEDYLKSDRTSFGSLSLPDIVSKEGASNDEIVGKNVEAVGMVYAGYQLEQARLFDVVDRITELFMDGLIPIGAGPAGKLLDEYYWSSEDRLSAPARASQFTRVLGTEGGEVSRDVVPNKSFDDLMLRFLSSVSELTRQDRLTELLDKRDSQARVSRVNQEYVKKAARDLAANASLYGWAYSHFAARRIGDHIRDAVAILNSPEIQRAYGVSGPWQVIERVASLELGGAPNIVRFRTMADSGKKIIDMLASKADGLVSGRPLISDAGDDNGVLTTAEFLYLSNAVENWLAVNGVGDEQVDRYSQPSDTRVAPSVPTAPSMANGSASQDALEQIRQLVNSGQTVSMDQIKGLLPANA